MKADPADHRGRRPGMTATDDSDQCRPTSGTGPPAGSPGHEPIGPKPYRKAVVIGGSIAGLMAARALADFFEEVHVFERDEYPDTPAARRGVPQAHHAHGLLARGRHIIEGFFPGIVAEMIDDGALLIDQVQDRLRLAPYGWQDRFPSDLTALMITRTLLEASIRRRTLRIGNIRITDNTAVQGLTSAGNTVTGLVLARRAHVEADLVVEAGGRGSSAHSWLEEHGFGRVEEEAIDARWGYASRFYRTPHPRPFDWTQFNKWPQVRASG
jgi:2-polyprenyl-6-methoxyphenol hydroxylase-like FAD-dependent oxidoreductase